MSRLYYSKPEFNRTRETIRSLLNPALSNRQVPSQTLNRIYENHVSGDKIELKSGDNIEFISSESLDDKHLRFKTEILDQIIEKEKCSTINYCRLLANEHIRHIENNHSQAKQFLHDPAILGRVYYDKMEDFVLTADGRKRGNRVPLSGETLAQQENLMCATLKIIERLNESVTYLARYVEVSFGMIDQRLTSMEYTLGLKDLESSPRRPPNHLSLLEKLLKQTSINSNLPEPITEIEEMKANMTPCPRNSIPVIEFEDDEEVIASVKNLETALTESKRPKGKKSSRTTKPTSTTTKPGPKPSTKFSNWTIEQVSRKEKTDKEVVKEDPQPMPQIRIKNENQHLDYQRRNHRHRAPPPQKNISEESIVLDESMEEDVPSTPENPTPIEASLTPALSQDVFSELEREIKSNGVTQTELDWLNSLVRDLEGGNDNEKAHQSTAVAAPTKNSWESLMELHEQTTRKIEQLNYLEARAGPSNRSSKPPRENLPKHPHGTNGTKRKKESMFN